MGREEFVNLPPLKRIGANPVEVLGAPSGVRLSESFEK